jgi:hypothetical protein
MITVEAALAVCTKNVILVAGNTFLKRKNIK